MGFPRRAIQDLIQGIANDDATPLLTYWDGAPVKFPGPKNGRPSGFIVLSARTFGTKGIDEQRRSWDPAGNSGAGVNRLTQVGVRSAMLTIDVKSFSFDAPAFDTCDLIRTRLRRADSLAQLRAVDCSLIQIFDIVELDEISDNRPIYRSRFDVKLAYAINDATITSDDGGIISSVNGNNVVPPAPGQPTR